MVKIFTIKDPFENAQRVYRMAPRWILASVIVFTAAASFVGVASVAYLVCWALLGLVGLGVILTIWRTRRDSIYTPFLFSFIAATSALNAGFYPMRFNSFWLFIPSFLQGVAVCAFVWYGSLIAFSSPIRRFCRLAPSDA